ncbi:hypothetical protein CLU79DRAFT_840569 [Phycomyces nitens]|nr:hypothetical protein CLU79DRAFT_840569 [Phycomyces nitens]
MSPWESAGVKYLTYVKVCTRAFRNSLKDNVREAVQQVNLERPRLATIPQEQKLAIAPKQ